MERSTGAWGIALGMVIFGSFLLAVHDRLRLGDSTGSAYLGFGWILVLGSAFAVRRLRWRLLLYIPAAYIAATFLSISFAPYAHRWVHRDALGAECQGWNSYISEVNSYAPTLSNRLNLLRNPATLTPARAQVIIGALETDIENWRTNDPPPAARALNNQLITVLSGWVEVFEAVRENRPTEALLYELQPEDDALEHLTGEANETCAPIRS